MKIISGTDLSKKIKASLKEEVTALTEQYKRAPKLVIILVGDDPSSVTYVSSKEKSCNALGILCDLLTFPASMSEAELLDKIDQLNQDDTVDAILVQLPLPDHIDKEKVLQAIDYKKDVDGLHPMNMGFLSGNQKGVIPCTPKGILSLLKAEGVEIQGKHCVIIGRSNLVGKPMSQLMIRENASVTVCHTKTKDLEYFTKQAEILIIAIGCPNFLNASMLKQGVVVIDVGINVVDGRLVGDLYSIGNVVDIEQKASAITPVPGGVGPMTIVSLLENTVLLYKWHLGIE